MVCVGKLTTLAFQCILYELCKISSFYGIDAKILQAIIEVACETSI